MTAMTTMFRRVSGRIGARDRWWRDDRSPVRSVHPSGPRIVILSASVGAGHIRAAQALESALIQMLPHATIAHIDVLQLTNSAFRRAYGKGYFGFVERAPRLVGLMYDMLDHPTDAGAGAKLRLTLERANFSRLTRFLTRQHWDLAINTHFLPPELIGWLRRGERVAFPQVTVVTDFDVHGMWLNDPCDGYFVANDEAKQYVTACGVDPALVHVTGIPIDPVFSESKDRDLCRLEHGFDCNRPLVLQMAGGFGVGSVEEIYRSLRGVVRPIQICVVTGNNIHAKNCLEMLGSHPRHLCRIIGYTQKVDELMAAADIVISKSGGLTTSESLARGCPMMVVEPIPGQEERNSDFLLENGCAIKANNLATLGHKLEALLNEPERLERMRLAALRCSRPNAARRIAAHCASFLPAPMETTAP